MDAFEHIVSEIFTSQGYWVQTEYKVVLTTEEKRQINRPSSPRWELDLIAFKPARNEVFVIECKSYLDSPGVTSCDLEPIIGTSQGRYKLFTERNLRSVVFKRLALQLTEMGLCQPDPTIKLGLVCGNIRSSKTNDHRSNLLRLSSENDWKLFDENWLHLQFLKIAETSYQNQISSVVAKLMTRGTPINKYAYITLLAAIRLQQSPIHPNNAWNYAARRVFPANLEARKKACPKNTFLGLCAAGLIKGVSTGDYTKSIQNKTYGIKASGILKKNPLLAQDPIHLWKQTMIELSEDNSKIHNEQMHVPSGYEPDELPGCSTPRASYMRRSQ